MNQTIPEAFFTGTKEFSQKKALFYKKNGIYFSLTFQELAQQIKSFASSLQQLGIKKEDKVAILSENRPEWVITDLGAILLGAIVVPIHTTLSPKIIGYILNHSQTKILIVSNSDLLNKVLIIQKELNFLEKIIFLEEIDKDSKQTLEKEILDWQKVISQGEKKTVKEIKLTPNDICSIIYTSGTTGIPKGVKLSHQNFLSNAWAANSAIPVKTSDIFLSFLPLSHVFERLAGYYVPLLFGATIAYAESFKQLAVNLKENKPTILVSVPRVFEKLYDVVWDKIRTASLGKRKIFLWALKQKKESFGYRIADQLVFRKIRKQLGGRLRLTVSGGASLDEKIARFFYKLGILILEGYGLTETSPVVTVNLEKNFKFGTVGKPVSGVEIKIAQDKEILVKGPNVMQGYFKNPKDSQEVIDQNGWFHTGDLGFIDSKGFLVIIGRKKEMIVTSGGKNIWPEAIEQELNRDKFITQSMIIGHNRKFLSALIVPDWEEVVIFLKENNLPIKEPEKLIKDPEIIKVFQKRLEKINENLADFERIRKFKLLVNEFCQEKDELTPTLKLRRHIIESHFQKEIEEVYKT